ncbi:hypothetical protein B0T26DRAFT_683805 [Lasiosphaeria miniovina]|uniref:Uncharacterized protein n=1 Tax=Lasiosphaeria miniovina TaxID=1954250 RepID=A0AA40BFM1_9PEZI|nr:uncharacterized protein B0T26DRAFT_683805 [Lasiosphaeria miniovina]KAK0733345.1 hypothetical protein B0T26DRAFT_683805 [Lasiosphaeria miniovina]
MDVSAASFSSHLQLSMLKFQAPGFVGTEPRRGGEGCPTEICLSIPPPLSRWVVFRAAKVKPLTPLSIVVGCLWRGSLHTAYIPPQYCIQNFHLAAGITPIVGSNAAEGTAIDAVYTC